MRDREARRPPILRSIRARLVVIFFLLTLLAVGVMYVVIAPPLTSSLQSEGIKALYLVAEQRTAGLKQIGANEPTRQKYVASLKRFATERAASAAALTGSSVTIVDVDLSGTATAAITGDAFATSSSAAPADSSIVDFAEGVAAAAGGSLRSSANGLSLAGFVIGKPQSKSATFRRVAVFSQPLNVGGFVSLIRSRLLLAAGIALLVALLTGVLVARALTVRLLRLEQVAQRVAQGDFEAHFSDDSRDELGHLARALAHMQNQLEGLEEARRRFIATASHELRTPIFSLGGFLELIQDEDVDEETRRQFVGVIREQVERLGKLATQLLDLSRLESGSVQLSQVPTDMAVLVRAVSSEFVPALAQHESELELRVPEDPVRAVCDPERVAQLLRILIDNALMHTAPGTPVRVAIAGSPNGSVEGGAGVRLLVSDHGPGIPPEALGRIFEPFYSADGAKGAGLGLAIAHELSLQMGAQLEVASEPGETTFTLILDGVG
ncbi:MAG: ATP-binding protein [Solirubrobacteraceae bacterium]